MKTNVGTYERFFRIGLGAVSLAVVPFVPSRLGQVLLGAFGVTGLATGLSRYCPVNEAMGFHSGIDRESIDALRHKFQSSISPAGPHENLLH